MSVYRQLGAAEYTPLTIDQAKVLERTSPTLHKGAVVQRVANLEQQVYGTAVSLATGGLVTDLTLTVDDIASGTLIITPGTGLVLTMPTAAELFAGLKLAGVVGSTYKFTLANGDAGNNITISGAADGITYVGSPACGPLSIITVVIAFTDVTPGSEAASVFGN